MNGKKKKKKKKKNCANYLQVIRERLMFRKTIAPKCNKTGSQKK